MNKKQRREKLEKLLVLLEVLNKEPWFVCTHQSLILHSYEKSSSNHFGVNGEITKCDFGFYELRKEYDDFI